MSLLAKLEDHFKNLDPEQFKKDWEEIEKMSEGVNSPTVEEFLKNQMKYATSTGSPLGSYHWFHTIVGRCLHMGEFIKEKGQPNEALLKEWGERLYKDSQELIKGYGFIGKEE